MTSWCVFVFGLISDLWNVICKERTKMYKQNLRQVRNWVFQRSAFYYKVFNWLSMCIIITIVFSNTAQSAYFIMLMLQANINLLFKSHSRRKHIVYVQLKSTHKVVLWMEWHWRRPTCSGFTIYSSVSVIQRCVW